MFGSARGERGSEHARELEFECIFGHWRECFCGESVKNLKRNRERERERNA